MDKEKIQTELRKLQMMCPKKAETIQLCLAKRTEPTTRKKEGAEETAGSESRQRSLRHSAPLAG